MTGADLLVRRLREHGVEVIFGYPGGQLTPIYDALARQGEIRHILARDEQAAAFMADGYARATGRPGVCLAVCGPGVLNALTPLATAFTDSIPVLLISGQILRAGMGLRSGYYHENEQAESARSCTRAVITINKPQHAAAEIDRAFRFAASGRPGPVLVQIPLDVQREEFELPTGQELRKPPLAGSDFPPRSEDVERLAQALQSWKKPLLLVGGGAVNASAEVLALAQRLGAPVFHTAMGKGVIPSDHPLCAGMPWQRATSDLRDMENNFSPLFSQADGLLAVGCRFSQLATGTWTLPLPAHLAQIDIDSEELGRHYPLEVGLAADARLSLAALLATLPDDNRQPWTSPPPVRLSEGWHLPGLDLLGPLRQALPPEAIVVADVTRAAYLMMTSFPIYQPRTFLHPAGYVSMGYAIPAALGARAVFPQRPIVVVVGDGGFMMSGMELATAVQENLPIVVVLVNDSCLTLIKAIQKRRYQERYLGVDLRNPDFALFAQAFGVPHWLACTTEEFVGALREALVSGTTALVEVRPGDARS